MISFACLKSIFKFNDMLRLDIILTASVVLYVAIFRTNSRHLTLTKIKNNNSCFFLLINFSIYLFDLLLNDEQLHLSYYLDMHIDLYVYHVQLQI